MGFELPASTVVPSDSSVASCFSCFTEPTVICYLWSIEAELELFMKEFEFCYRLSSAICSAEPYLNGLDALLDIAKEMSSSCRSSSIMLCLG